MKKLVAKALKKVVKSTSSRTAKGSDEPKYQIAPKLITRKNQNGTVILMKLEESSHFYKIDGIAAEIWYALVDSPKSSSALVREFAKNYGDHTEQLEKDVPVFLKQLSQKQLIVKA